MTERVWRGWAIADATGRLVVDDSSWPVPYIYKYKRDAMQDKNDGQIVVRVTVTAFPSAKPAEGTE